MRNNMWMEDNGKACKVASATIKVRGSMTRLRDGLFELDGLRRVIFDAHTSTIRVDYDPTRMSQKQIKRLCHN
jgi:hypothetical protein